MNTTEELYRNCPVFPTLGSQEQHAVLETLKHAETHGYGNLMAWLATMWNIKLRREMPHLKSGELPMPTVQTTPYTILEKGESLEEENQRLRQELAFYKTEMEKTVKALNGTAD
jgi:tRNA-dihydrouridine synthase